MNRRINLALIGLVFCVTVFGAQDSPRIGRSRAPNLTGTWVFNLSKSDIGSPAGSPLYDQLTLTILHREPELQILRQLRKKKREISQRLVYYTDKRGESNPTIDGRNRLRSKTSWEANVLISSGVSQQEIPFGYVKTETTERWELSPDGNTLKQISSFKFTFIINGNVSPGDKQQIVRVFEKR